MRKILTRVWILLIGIVALFSCVACLNFNEDKMNEIPERNITYEYIEIGNVIDEGKMAVFFRFSSDYVVEKMEIAGTLLDRNGNAIYTFDEKMNFGLPSKVARPAVRIEENLARRVKSVSFTKVKAYTKEKINR